MKSWVKDSWKWGAVSGIATATAGAVEMLAANGLTINPLSSIVLVATWLAAGAAVGFVVGALGGRAATIVRGQFRDGALGMSVLTVGHLLLPTGVGILMALGVLALRRLRRWLFPSAQRADLALAAGASMLVMLVPQAGPAFPPTETADVPLTSASPLPGSVPVTISIHPAGDFPGIPAVHLPLRALASREPGRRAALWSGRLPDRTRVGRDQARVLPGGGGISRFPAAPGARWLAALFPSAVAMDREPFALVGTLAAQCEAAGIPVLRTPPAPGDPPHLLRILDGARAPGLDTAEQLREGAAWIDVTLEENGGRVAFSGTGLVLTRATGYVNLVDVTPTALHLLGLPVPRSCDGRVLLELMDNPGPGSRPVRYRELTRAEPRPGHVSRATTSR